MPTSVPYPAGTRSKGWRYELDMERVRQSDTWALAPREVRPWLFMVWLVAWEQTPCGSLPGDDDLVAARIDIPPALWVKHKAILLRGWELADDGRRYHRVVAEMVLEMMARRRKESDRKYLARQRKATEEHGSPVDVPRDKTGTDEGLHPESATGTGTGTRTGIQKGKVVDSVVIGGAGGTQLPGVPPSEPTPAGPETAGSRVADAPPTPPAAPAPRGCRLRPDWALPKTWGEWALVEYPHWTAATVRLVAATFRDHWVAETGRNATKANWEATWRNWCRSDITQRQFGPNRPRLAAGNPAPFDKAARDAEAAQLLGFDLPPPRSPSPPADLVDAATGYSGATPPALPTPSAAPPRQPEFVLADGTEPAITP